jgi:hypothetical protein
MQRFGWGKTNKKDAVLSFYLKTNKTGVYSWYFQTPTGPRHRTISFTVSDTNWNRYSIPVSADTVAIPSGNGEGLQIRLNLINSPDSDYASGTDSGWGTTTYFNDDDQVNFLDNTSNILYLTGMMFELGSVATPYEHRSYADELARCQRYYQNSYRLGEVPATSTPNHADGQYMTRWNDGNVTGPRWTVAMRAAPTVTIRGYGSNTTGQVIVSGGSLITSSSAQAINHQSCAYININDSTGGVWAHYCWEALAEL